MAAPLPFSPARKPWNAGANWPKLQSLLKVESSSEILTALLSLSEQQHEALEQDEAWPAELKGFAKAGDSRQARDIVSFRKESIWVREADRQLLWTVCERGLDLLEAVESIQPQWKKSVNGLAVLFSWYESHIQAGGHPASQL